MADVFISYAQEDRTRAGMLAAALEARGLSVWWDREIPAGRPWAEVIEEAISSSSCVVVLWSRHSVTSRWVQREARFGDERGRLVPARLDDADLPFEFGDLQAADLRRWTGGKDRQLDRLVGWIDEAIDETSADAPSRIRPTRRRRGRKRAGSVGGLIALLGLGFLGYAIIDIDYWRMRFEAEGWSVLSQLNAGPMESVPQREVCREAAYLCDALSDRQYVMLQRLPGRTAPLVVHVPPPPVADVRAAATLLDAAVQGLLAWDRQPFALALDRTGARPADITVTWNDDHPGGEVGRARTTWSPAAGLTVDGIELAAHDPTAPDRLLSAPEVSAAAAHMMGHALGLPHSSVDDDVMSTALGASRLSRRDRQAALLLYRLPPGTVIVRDR